MFTKFAFSCVLYYFGCDHLQLYLTLLYFHSRKQTALFLLHNNDSGSLCSITLFFFSGNKSLLCTKSPIKFQRPHRIMVMSYNIFPLYRYVLCPSVLCEVSPQRTLFASVCRTPPHQTPIERMSETNLLLV